MIAHHNSVVAASERTSPWLSILIPVHNVKLYLEDCVVSVMSQVDEAVEVILLDDCSTDGSFELMQLLAQRWPNRLLLLQQATNSGPSAARNAMIEVARGEYLWFLDSDDKLLPNAVAELRATVDAYSPDLVLCDFAVYRENPKFKHWMRGERHKHTFSGQQRMILRDPAALLAGMLRTGQLHPWSKISRRKLWTPDVRFPEGRYFEDMLAMLTMASKADSFFYMPHPWVAYRQRATSILGDMNMQKVRDQSSALLPLWPTLQTKQWANNAALRFALAHQCARNLTGAMRYMAAQCSQIMTLEETQSLAATFRADFNAASPLSAAELKKEYVFKGWWASFVKFRRWFGYKSENE
ncbi:glycosyltransferase family 2 protein [Oxalicibacterium faecigallinarum]|uniref:Glycosyltransferase 2-like domain-containing protein n=1 Tax=Oxalicibacterium faecigallinarum TaxID=573741 RepID=A0A8J3AW02_9BURK|nr:glycosyltransferase family 2 protein [Oxalicibacterium faecigallinarum]GGI17882.1 hypothetical protein GCM10008066_11210 [Oxalicibacterium faecigallinarum]